MTNTDYAKFGKRFSRESGITPLMAALGKAQRKGQVEMPTGTVKPHLGKQLLGCCTPELYIVVISEEDKDLVNIATSSNVIGFTESILTISLLVIPIFKASCLASHLFTLTLLI